MVAESCDVCFCLLCAISYKRQEHLGVGAKWSNEGLKVEEANNTLETKNILRPRRF